VGGYGYAPCFLVVGLLHPLAFGVLLVTVRRVGKVA
jgi:hypothetical protein